ncbi:hypothetical protein NLI96_g12829 [Meripilus lineatus]|uniref:Uncharacterized protein n=1 Tax=Meripilus lineatus TaxID=2056292 RepID=A0AAD5UP59_9APHY|nr:hypothetical protein NLI96_g12829 [Physisporinus lineatus]
MSFTQNRRHLACKCLNIENVVPQSNKSVSVNRSGLQRIRRKVSGVKLYIFTANTPEHQMKKCLLKSRASRQGELTPPAIPEVHLKATPSPESPTKLNIPRTLKHPPMCPVSLENLTSILPVFKNTPLPFIRDTLQAMSDPMQRVLAGVQSTIPDNKVLPKQIDITLNNLDAGAPTHMLVIFPRTTFSWELG